MSDSASPSALFDGRVGAGQKAMLPGLLWTLASLATALAIYAIVLLISAQNHRVAGRTIIDVQKGAGYFDVLIPSLAAHHGRPYKGL